MIEKVKETMQDFKDREEGKFYDPIEATGSFTEEINKPLTKTDLQAYIAGRLKYLGVLQRSFRLSEATLDRFKAEEDELRRIKTLVDRLVC